MNFTFNKFITSHSIQKLLVLAMLFVLNFGYSSTPPINPFITTWQTNTLTSVIIPLSGSGYDFTIDWGDGTTETKTGNLGRSITHLYATVGIKTVTITPNTVTGFPIFYMNDLGNCNTFLKTIAQWGGGQWSSMQRAFYGATTMDVTATDTPNLSNVTDFLYMFLNCSALTNANGSMANWTFITDPTKNINMSTMFQSATLFNQNISAWNMTRVTNTSAMFYAASAFNQDISSWDVSNVTNMSNMFYSTKFNQNINAWNVANVIDMSSMFAVTTAFNQPLNAWNVSKVANMTSMFQSSQLFNQNIGSWNVSAVTNMTSMFLSSVLFNHG
jgi:surface protein